ncbi:hypothetical protein IC628_09440 [Photobacterium damselae subsp. piscicida]|uniref:hypothetical protein n=1 Tax=Photobacterium damselae TaxID=38293 RepID=UPI0017463ADF|nr:hypothetical protein [Photobacterium damselae]QOD51718.1 hypothetical protein IC628_09440 [Photobacterium damselae subsp. piscicida]
MSLKQAFSFILYHSSLNKLQRRKSRIEEDFYKSQLFIENGYELANGDYEEKLVKELLKMIREKNLTLKLKNLKACLEIQQLLNHIKNFFQNIKIKIREFY